jgi:cysteine desulfurase
MPVYLDYNATAPLSSAARTAWLAAQDEAWGNPGSIHAVGQLARHRLDQAKTAIATALGCAAGELVVTSGGSEANATAIHAALAKGGVALSSAIEHSSVLRNIALWTDSTRQLPVDGLGRLAPATVAAAVDAQTSLLCVQLANNEIGTLQEVSALAAAARAANPAIWVHCDAAQGPG